MTPAIFESQSPLLKGRLERIPRIEDRGPLPSEQQDLEGQGMGVAFPAVLTNEDLLLR